MSAGGPSGTPALPPRVRALVDRVLTREEFTRLLEVPLSEAEREGTRALVAWFTRRYPTPAQRSAYVRRAVARWGRHQTKTASDGG